MPPAATGIRATIIRRRSIRTSWAPGRAITDDRGQLPLPHHQAGRLSRGATITTRGVRRTSISRCSAPALVTRLVTQMYFPNDPLIPLDPILNSIPRRRRAAAAGLALRSLAHRARVGAGLPFRHRAARPPRHAVRGARRDEPDSRAHRRRSGRSSISRLTTNPSLGHAGAAMAPKASASGWRSA